jgi:hypothetical protein
MFSPDADSDLILLLTIYDPINPETVMFRIADNFTQRLSETDVDIVYGVKSNEQDFVFLPIQISLPTEEEAQAPRCTLVLHDVTRLATAWIRTITGPPKVKMELVLSKSPDIIEASFSGFYITSFNYNAETVSAELAMVDYEREPFPMHSFSPAYFPGMF